MGRSNYICEYCDKRMKDNLDIRRKHILSLAHQTAMKEHYAKFKDIRTILREETQKRPCQRFQTNQCKFGIGCRFSHFSSAQIYEMQQQVNRDDLEQQSAQTSQPIDERIIIDHLQEVNAQFDPKNTCLSFVRRREMPKILAKWGVKLGETLPKT